LAPKAFRVETGTVAAVYSLLLAACGGFVFYASVRPVPMPSGVLDIPWFAVLLALAITWLAVPVALLALGLAYLRQGARLRWRLAVTWACAVAAGFAVGWVNLHDYAHWLAWARWIVTMQLPPYPRPAGPQWRSLVAAGGQLAAGAAMIALIAASARKATPTAGPADGTFVGSAR
jgi:hypothetical protein